MPFEQYMGQASPASDLYGLGATLLHRMTGRPPADFVSPDGHLRVPEVLPGGPTLRAVVTRLLAHAAEDRYASAREVRAALLAVVADAGSITSPPTRALAVTATRRSGGLAPHEVDRVGCELVRLRR